MANFAKINNNNIVESILYISNEDILDENGKESEQKGIDHLNKHNGQANWVQTSKSGSFRKEYAIIGGTYDPILDEFRRPKPFQSWTYNENTREWNSPIEKPNIFIPGAYIEESTLEKPILYGNDIYEDHYTTWEEENLRWVSRRKDNNQIAYIWNPINKIWFSN
jgi:hypothetical protein